MSASPSFSPTCSWCSTGHGIPTSVGFTGNQRTVTYRCPECQHAWTETEWVPRLMMQPEPPSSTPRFFQK
jgi:hypothetical protein